jgi:hypothetical protein
MDHPDVLKCVDPERLQDGSRESQLVERLGEQLRGVHCSLPAMLVAARRPLRGGARDVVARGGLD